MSPFDLITLQKVKRTPRWQQKAPPRRRSGDSVRDVSVCAGTVSIPAIDNNISNGLLTASGAAEIPSAAV